MQFPRLHLVVLDCPDPFALASFYAALTGIPVETWPDCDPAEMDGIDLVHLHEPTLSFERVENYVPPTWPSDHRPKQLHLDFLVDDLDKAEVHALECGATKATFQPSPDFRVFLDPVGHPFCLITSDEER